MVALLGIDLGPSVAGSVQELLLGVRTARIHHVHGHLVQVRDAPTRKTLRERRAAQRVRHQGNWQERLQDTLETLQRKAPSTLQAA